MSFDVQTDFYGGRAIKTVRESVAVRRHIEYFDVTLSTEGTAQDLINISNFAQPAYNLLLNPLFVEESSAIPNWTLGTNTTAASVASALGGNSLTLGEAGYGFTKAADAATGGVIQTIQHPPPGRYAVTARVAGVPTATTNTYEIGIVAWNSTDSIDSVPDSAGESSVFRASSDATTWGNVTMIHTVPQNTESLSVFVGITGLTRHTGGSADVTGGSITAYVEGVQFEPDWGVVSGSLSQRELYTHSPVFTGFIIPDSDRYARYTTERGTTRLNSTTIREQRMREIMLVHIDAHNQNMRVDFDRTATDSSLFIPRNATFEHALAVRERISFVNEGSNTPRAVGYVMGN